MAFLFLNNQQKISQLELSRKILTAGAGPGFDISLFTQNMNGLFFTLVQSDHGHEIYPSGQIGELTLNGKKITNRRPLKTLDKVEWPNGSFVFLETLPEFQKSSQPPTALACLKLIEKLTDHVMVENSSQADNVESAFAQLLNELLALSNAEGSYLLTENSRTSEWEIVATASLDKDVFERSDLLSHTALTQAVKDRKPVYVENIIGHPLSAAQSIMMSKIFSLACFPLMVHSKIFGALFLFTRTPGKSIRKECLEEFRIIGTQAALLLASTQEKGSVSPKTILQIPNKNTIHWGQTPIIQDLKNRIQKLAPTDLNLLLLGETGVGKELVAREAHKLSTRRDRPFVAINCAAIPAPLIESILFGVEKGAYTGAHQSRKGKFEEAHEGTLFLDEIGDLPLELQSKLLRVIQEKIVEPVGGKKSREVNVRIIAATHCDLERKIQLQEFRSDLFFRLKGAVLEIPPLRKRKDDIIPLAQFFLNQNGLKLNIAPKAAEKLLNHQWPGNIRELEQSILRASALSDGQMINDKDIETSATKSGHFATDFNGDELKKAQLKFTYNFVQSALEKNKGNRAITAMELGISERSLYRILSHTNSTANYDMSV
jgi:transcriptional regulator with GAF, ATPase, and Fis domain